jgi:starch phosphorylase
LLTATVEPMEQVERLDDVQRRYVGRFRPARAGRYGYTVRVVPANPDLVTPVELGLVGWAAS